MELKHGSFFTGIDVFGEAAKQAGMSNVFGCEIDPVTRLHFTERNPGAMLYDDIKTVETVPYVDVLTFGFPCQDVSNAQPVKNYYPLEYGTRTILIWEAMRIIRNAEKKPPFIVAENVNAIRSKGLEKILEAFASCGYIPSYATLSASLFGAMHQRKRVFIIAHASSFRWDTGIKIWDRILEKREKKHVQRQFDRSVLQAFQSEADGARFGNYDGTTRQLFDGLMVKAAGNAIYYPIAEIIINEILKELKITTT